MLTKIFSSLSRTQRVPLALSPASPVTGSTENHEWRSTPPERVGIIAGNGNFPILVAQGARARGVYTVALCHQGETVPELESAVDKAVWLKVGELGKIIATFKQHSVRQVVMAGGINRIKLFGGVKLDLRGAQLLAKLRSTKDDVLMRGIADELAGEGIEVIESTVFMKDHFVAQGVLTKSAPTADELNDIEVGIAAIKAMSGQDIGQLVVVREGVVVAVEAVEGSDAAIRRGGELGGKGSVVVKFAKPTQDMRFDVPVVGLKTIESMNQVRARVLAVEAGRCLILDREELIARANRYGIAVIGCASLVS